ncbi:NapC/NirT family cytochrome c [uncultured Ferrimonas sp.]|uniref:NapC/NirT family cytochrome c n=1 Tax=uncultured Ferrimonas sp. TaxID=432640 RepID=UPI00262FCFC7|nr:NapC/NirT family cytochrome c [uncultured Ferrimonas sp.]
MTKPSSLWQRPTARWRLGLPIGALLMVVIGVLATVGFNGVMQATSSNEFCSSCHGPAAFAAEEWPQHTHFTSASGVKVQCADCHVSKQFLPKMWRKVQGMKEVYHYAVGTYDSREKFELHRLDMAKKVWAEMKATDSATCRSCHNYQRMDFTKQSAKAQLWHPSIAEKGLTCIDCHKYLAHDRVATELQ